MFQNRIKNLRKNLDSNKVHALIVSSAVNIAYLTGCSNFSRHEREAYLFVTGANTLLFTDGRYIEAARKILPKGIKVFLHAGLYKKIRGSKAERIGVEQNFTLAELKKFKKKTGKKLYLTDWLIEKLRSVKGPEEIKNIRTACRLTDKTFDMVQEFIKIGVTEKEVAWEIEKFIKENGGELAFESIVAFGPNSAIPHHKTSDKRLAKSDELVLLDFGAKVNGYCSDMTRTLLTKNSSNKSHKIYQTVLDSQQQCINALMHYHISTKVSDIAKAANDYLVSKGFEPIPHGLGHGIGLEVHEEPRLSPKLKDELVKGNVFTIEPGIYIPGFGGIRIEDDFLLSDKLEQLTKSPKEIIEI